VDDITLQIMRGETLGVVGESGCGKSTLAKGIIGLEKISGGGAEFLQFDLSEPLAGRALDLVKDIQMVFQNPDATLNPSFVVGRQIARPLKRFRSVAGNRVRSEVDRLLQAVRLNPNYYNRFPRQLSGGEKQRVGIARALASRPELMICDEPVSALDVSVQAAVLNLLKDIQAETGNTIMFIAHDLSVVRFFAGFIIVMYLGQIAEYGPTESIFNLPYHPYTEALLSAVPIPDPDAQERRIRLSGEVPSSLNPPTGCRFHTRCPRRGALPDGGKVCETQPPPMRELHAGHLIFCHLSAQDLAGLQSEL
jgi:peptide/nickel transport system ATP-binding protein